MSRTNDVNIAMQYAKSGVDGVHLMDSHKATIGWVVNTLAAEVERLEAECLEAKCYMVQHARERGREMQRAEAAEARVKELELKLMRQDEVAREACEAAVWKYGQERMELEARVAELEAQIAEVVGSQRNEDKSLPTWAQVMNRVALLTEQNATLRAALERLDALYISEFDHEDRPPRPQWLQAALNGEEAST